MEIKITTKETAHLIDRIPLNYALNLIIGGILITTEGTWEYIELMRLRKYNKALHADQNTTGESSTGACSIPSEGCTAR